MMNGMLSGLSCDPDGGPAVLDGSDPTLGDVSGTITTFVTKRPLLGKRHVPFTHCAKRQASVTQKVRSHGPIFVSLLKRIGIFRSTCET